MGAGPAGLGLSIIGSKRGLKTILMGKRSEIGYPAKASAFTWKEVVENWGLPNSVVSQWIDSFYICSVHSDREVEIDFGSFIGGTSNYHIFLQELAFQAIRHDTKISLSECVSEPIMDGNFVCGIKTAKKHRNKI